MDDSLPPHSWYKSTGAYLYSIDPNTQPPQMSVVTSSGETHAGRMIHTDSYGTKRLLIGRHIVDSNGNVSELNPDILKGRITAITAHLTDKNKAYYYTMEQGLYEVDVVTREIKTIHQDANAQLGSSTNFIPNPMVPGAHGKGAYTGQGRFIIANNGYDQERNDTGSLSSSNNVPYFSIIELLRGEILTM